jgi:hypothetical protein
MTTIITRLYADAKTANAVRNALLDAGNAPETVDVIRKADLGEGQSAQGRIEAAMVRPEAAAAYASGVESGKVLVVCRAPFMPIGTALNAIKIVDGSPSIDAGVANQNFYLTDVPKPSELEFLPKILKDHPRFLYKDKDLARHRGTITDKWGFKLLSKRAPKNVLLKGEPHVSTKFWPMPLLSRRKPKDNLIHGFVSTRFLKWPLLSKRTPSKDVLAENGPIFSKRLGLPLLIER